MRIVQVEEFFHPDAGYQVNLLSKYFSKEGHEVVIVAAEMDNMPAELTTFFGKDNILEQDRQYEMKYNVKIIRVQTLFGLKKSWRIWYKREIFKIVNGLDPDIVFVHGNDTFTGIRFILKAGHLKYPIVCDSHMLEMASVSKLRKPFRLFYKMFVTPQIKKHHIPVIRTQEDDYVERCLGIPLSNCPWISYGSDLMLFHPDYHQREIFRKQYNISDDAFVVVFSGKLVESKGAMLLAQAFQKKYSSDREVVLIAIGSAPGEYGKKVEEALSRSQNRVLRFPTQKYEALPIFYQASDIAVFAKQCSLSFYDVQACGLPVVSENNNINQERCSHNNGLCFDAGDLNAFIEKINAFISMEKKTFSTYAKNSTDFVTSEYDYRQKAIEYINVLNTARDNWKKNKTK